MEKSQQGFSLTRLGIIHIYSTMVWYQITYSHLSLEALFMHSSACLTFTIISD